MSGRTVLTSAEVEALSQGAFNRRLLLEVRAMRALIDGMLAAKETQQ